MIKLRDPRFWTVLVVVALALAALTNGLTVFRFGLAEALADASTAEARLRPFAGDPTLGAVAHRDMIVLAPPVDAKQRVADLTELLSQSPLSSGAWLDLAIARRAAGASTESVAAALALSATTGPNEAVFMAGRASFALPFWSALPPDARRSLIGDLVGAWGAVDGPGRARLAAILQNGADGTREGVRAALLLNGDAGALIASALLPPPKPEMQGPEMGSPSTPLLKP
jgi:hypothetical protein